MSDRLTLLMQEAIEQPGPDTLNVLADSLEEYGIATHALVRREATRNQRRTAATTHDTRHSVALILALDASRISAEECKIADRMLAWEERAEEILGPGNVHGLRSAISMYGSGILKLLSGPMASFNLPDFDRVQQVLEQSRDYRCVLYLGASILEMHGHAIRIFNGRNEEDRRRGPLVANTHLQLNGVSAYSTSYAPAYMLVSNTPELEYFDRTWNEQAEEDDRGIWRPRSRSDHRIISSPELMNFLLLCENDTGIRLSGTTYLRCCDKSNAGLQVCVGSFGLEGLIVDGFIFEPRNHRIGIAYCKEFREPYL